MQRSRQKRRQIGAGDAPAELGLGTAKTPERGEQVGHERGHAIRSTVRKSGFGERPDAFVGVQLWGVGGEELRVETRDAVAEGANERPLVNPAVVPEEDDRPAQVTQEVAEELAHLGLTDIAAVHPVVQAESMPAWTHREARNDREAVVTLPEAQQWGLPARGPGLAHAGDQEEPGLVDEDEVGAQPRGVFFTRGHTRRFQWAMRCSSR